MPAVPSLGETQIVRPMRLAVVAFAWVCFLLALPVVTNAGLDGCLTCSLVGLAVPIGGVWATSTLFSGVKVERRDRLLWWSVPTLGALTLGLALTDLDLVVRVRLSEPALSAYAEAVRRGEVAEQSHHPVRRVGLMAVTDTSSGGDGEVRLITSTHVLDRTGLAYRPDEPPDPTDGRYRHLVGPWYTFFDRF